MAAFTPAPLFDRLSPDLFRLLGMPNGRRYWSVLSRLMDEIWGDGGRSPGEEAPRAVVVRAVESFLAADDPWEGDVESSLNVRAHEITGKLVENGWLALRRRGAVDMLTVRPVIAQFYTVLCDFSVQEPEFIGSKFRSILLNLQAVADGNAFDQYMEAARQARACLNHIVNTGCRVQDLMAELLTRTSARDFVRGFFEEYIQNVFIADYSDLRTRDHPLQHRSSIIAMTLQFTEDEARREALIGWYQEKMTAGDRERAEARFERDSRQLLRLREVDEQLRRLDDEIRSANQQGLLLMAYSMRAPRHLDKLINHSLAALDSLDEGAVALPAAPGARHASGWGLAKPRSRPRVAVSTGVETTPPTLEELAMEALRRRMSENRMVKPVQLANYLARHLDGRKAISSDDLSIDTINDLCCYQRLLLIASRNDCPPAMRRFDPQLQMVRGVRIAFDPAGQTQNIHMQHRRFSVQKERA
jgi:hypothetical protein